jgi:hypothetical protein
MENGHHHHDKEHQQREKKKVPYVKKPLNAFMLFMREQRQKVIEECTLKESAAINQILGRKVSILLWVRGPDTIHERTIYLCHLAFTGGGLYSLSIFHCATFILLSRFSRHNSGGCLGVVVGR